MDISYSEVDYAIDRVTVGLQKTTGTSFPNRQRLVAYHEAGHAVMGALTPDYDMVTKVTVIPRTNGAGGFTLFTPSEERLESGMYSIGMAPVAWETPEGNGMMQPRTASPGMETEIDMQVQKIVNDAFDKCYSALNTNRALMDAVATGLIEKETIDYQELQQMRDAHFSKELEPAR